MCISRVSGGRCRYEFTAQLAEDTGRKDKEGSSMDAAVRVARRGGGRGGKGGEASPSTSLPVFGTAQQPAVNSQQSLLGSPGSAQQSLMGADSSVDQVRCLMEDLMAMPHDVTFVLDDGTEVGASDNGNVSAGAVELRTCRAVTLHTAGKVARYCGQLSEAERLLSQALRKAISQPPGH